VDRGEDVRKKFDRKEVERKREKERKIPVRKS
jgi:hypothetical protein